MTTEPEGGVSRALVEGDRRLLVVEGEDAFSSLEPHVLEPLVGAFLVEVLPVGGHVNVAAAADVFRRVWARTSAMIEPDCYRIVDRDHRDDDEVEDTWQNGPFAEGRKRLIWRRHEIENYFIEPEFIVQSEHFADTASVEGVRKALLRAARQRAFLDAANLVVKRMRAESTHFAVREFQMNEGDFATPEGAETALLEGRDHDALRRAHSKPYTKRWLRQQLRGYLTALFGDDDWTDLQWERERGYTAWRAALSSALSYPHGS